MLSLIPKISWNKRIPGPAPDVGAAQYASKLPEPSGASIRSYRCSTTMRGRLRDGSDRFRSALLRVIPMFMERQSRMPVRSAAAWIRERAVDGAGGSQLGRRWQARSEVVVADDVLVGERGVGGIERGDRV